MLLVLIVLLLGVGVTCLVLAGGVRKRSRRRATQVADKYRLTEWFASEDTAQFIGFDFERGRVVAADLAFDRQYEFADISSVALERDGVTVTSTDRGSQLVGAAVGGALLGGVGALLGGLSSSATTSQQLKSIVLRVVFDDPARPVHEVTFGAWLAKSGMRPGWPQARQAAALAERFHAHCINAMRRAAARPADRVQERSA